MPLRIPARRRHRVLFARALALAALTGVPPPRPFGLKTQDCPGCCKNCWPKSEQQGDGGGSQSEETDKQLGVEDEGGSQSEETTIQQTESEVQSEQV